VLPIFLALIALSAPASTTPALQDGGRTKAVFVKKAEVPGMVLIKGGSTKIGLTVKEVERMTAQDENVWKKAKVLGSATPQHTVKIADFYMQVNETTNEQYRAYVLAAGAKPPEHWGEAAINEAQQTFLNEQGRIRQAAREKGEPVPPSKEFERPRWWKKNWQGQTWAIPDGAVHRPVVFVDYSDAQAFARWAGFRLPTEFEYQRAVRGNTTRLYPWGDEWDDARYCATNALRGINQAFPVGSYPAGKSEVGIYDLAGNVWEWTASDFMPYPGFVVDPYEQYSRPWFGCRKVLRGGCWMTRTRMLRPTWRNYFTPDRRDVFAGFRTCAIER